MNNFKMINKIKGIVFDCDGVIIQSKEANIHFYNLILQQLGLPVMDQAQEEFVHSHTVTESIAHIVPNARLNEALEVGRNMSYLKVLPFIKIEPGIRELLQNLKKKGYLLAINTNRTTTMSLILENFQLENYFQPVITAAQVTWPKPHPESLHKILFTWGLKREEIAFIGDSEVDAQAAFEAEVQFWAYQNKMLEADLHLSDYWSLQGILLNNSSLNGF